MNTNSCPKCNTNFDQSKKFCGKCGVPLVAGSSDIAATVSSSEAAEPEVKKETPPTSKLRNSAIILGIIVISFFTVLFAYEKWNEFRIKTSPHFIDASKLVQKYYGPKYHIATDKELGWDNSTLEQLIKPQRAKNPTFPYLAIGDFNGDGKTPDYACFIINPNNKSDKRLVIFHNGYSKPDDVGNVISDGIDFVPKQKIKSHWESYTLNMKGDGISVFKFESASRLFYWNGKKYSFYQLTD